MRWLSALAVCLLANGAFGQSPGNPPNGAVWTYLGSTQGASWSAVPCPSITAYGGVGDGVTDNLAAWNALTAVSRCVHFPRGIYLFSAQINMALTAANQAPNIHGDGPDNTVLVWSAGGGLNITSGFQRSAVHIRDLTFLTSAINVGTAINIDWGSQHNTDMASSTIERVRIAGDTVGTTYWATNIHFNGVSQINLYSVDSFCGINNYPNPSGIGLDLSASLANKSYITNVVSSNFFGCQYGIRQGKNVEGLSITATNIMDNYYGIYSPPATGAERQAQTSVVNSQLQNWSASIEFDGGNNGMIANNLFYTKPGTNVAAIRVNDGGFFQFVNNQFSGSGLSGAVDYTAIDVISNTTVGDMVSNSISGTLCVLTTRCIRLGTGATGWRVINTQTDGQSGGNIAVINNATPGKNLVLGFVQQAAMMFPQTHIVSAAANSGGLINCTLQTAMTTGNSLVTDQMVLATLPGVLNAPLPYRVTVIDSTHVTLQASAFAGSLTLNGVLAVLP